MINIILAVSLDTKLGNSNQIQIFNKVYTRKKKVSENAQTISEFWGARSPNEKERALFEMQACVFCMDLIVLYCFATL